ncbi:DUF1501 domain-containing protein [Anabaena sp. UHCC 0451]|uniref:DUF1501 domain-containing protein n=1 Tax=Anabaena sp. UHCC 0451 TaxID=2055235 RepID=UPI002B20D848|nr:DUF1501 domain-containing protein [Anabaena sp. UHCC 0451]MEA5576688.1 DUF1501 domain-containing protein [Anabaena sp. UHCC 0451]
MKRRDFLIQAGLFSTSLITTIGSHAWVAHSATAKSNPKRLIVIFLRGGVDGLSLVVPYSETAYYQARPKIAIPQPGKQGGVIDLDGRFGLNPALSPLTPFWQKGNLAFVHACGSPDPTRSHFDAQKYMESGTPGNKGTRDGWMNRLLGVIAKKTPVQAVTVGQNTPWILYGQMPIANLPSGGKPNQRLLIDRPQVATAFDQLYSGKDSLSQSYRQGRMARAAIMNDLDQEMKMANNGAPLPNGFAKDASRLAQLMVKDSRIELGFMAVGGWDTHANQGSSQGLLANNLGKLGKGLAVLVEGLGNVYQNTTIVVMSEFGRTVQQNNNAGTDHGHGNVVWVLGGKVRGGKVYGEWPGLSPSQLYQKRDLDISTDFRDVISNLLQNHLNLNTSQLNQILPNYKPTQKIALL